MMKDEMPCGYWNKRVRALTPYVPGEQPKDQPFIKLNTNENPYPPSPAALKALSAAADASLRLYPDPSCAALRVALSQKYGARPEEIFTGNGSDEILAFAFGAFFESGAGAKRIFFPDITYSFYPVYADLWDIPYREIPLNNAWQINKDDYLREAGGVIFPNPNAPTGCALALKDIEEIAHFHARHNTAVIIDEAYGAFSEESAVSFALRHTDNILTVHTCSKSYALAGLRAGYAIGNAALIRGLERMRDSFNSYTVDRAAQAAACEAVKDSAYYEEITLKIKATRERVRTALEKLRFAVLPSSANFLLIKHPVMGGADFALLLRQKGILVRHFAKERIKDFNRVTIGTDKDMDYFLEICAASC